MADLHRKQFLKGTLLDSAFLQLWHLCVSSGLESDMVGDCSRLSEDLVED